MKNDYEKLRCFACGKVIRTGGKKHLADTRDGQLVWVGPDCFKHIEDGWNLGYQPPRGGPRLYPT